jgi:hypothetical protein
VLLAFDAGNGRKALQPRENQLCRREVSQSRPQHFEAHKSSTPTNVPSRTEIAVKELHGSREVPETGCLSRQAKGRFSGFCCKREFSKRGARKRKFTGFDG